MGHCGALVSYHRHGLSSQDPSEHACTTYLYLTRRCELGADECHQAQASDHPQANTYTSTNTANRLHQLASSRFALQCLEQHFFSLRSGLQPSFLSLQTVMPAVCVPSHTRFLARPFYVLPPISLLFFSSSSLLSSLLGDISWVRWAACVIINLGGRGPLLSVPPPHGMEAGSPRRRMRRMSRRFPRGFLHGN